MHMPDTTAAMRTLRRNRARVGEIAGAFSRYGFASWVSAGVPPSLSGLADRLVDDELAAMSEGERLRGLCVELGTTFIKLAQLLSTRRDIVGDEVAEALAELQARVPPDSPEVVRQIIVEQLGAEPEELFDEFSYEALGSASIAQVHTARLDGSEVVIKVQHAGTAERIQSDLDILEALAVLLEANDPDLAVYRPVEVMGQARRSLLAEVNFRLEAAHLAEVGSNFAGEPDVVIPTPYPQVSSDRVLTMSRVPGKPLSDTISDLGDNAESFVRRGADIYIEMIFRDGLFHADPHPGNLVWIEQPAEAVEEGQPSFHVGLLDFGKVGTLDDDQSDVIDAFVLAALNRDLDALIDSLLSICDPPLTLDRSALRGDVAGWIDMFATTGAANIDVAGSSRAAEDIMRRHRLYLPSDFALLMNTLTQLQGLLVETGVHIELRELLEPYAAMIAAKRFAPQRLLRQAQSSSRDWQRLVDTFPVEVASILQGIRAGQIEVPLRLEHLDRNVNRLVYAIITAAVFQGSARLWQSRTPPVLGGVSVPGAVGTIAAGGVAVRLLRSAKRAGGIG